VPGCLDAEGLEWLGGGDGGDGILGKGDLKKFQHTQASGAWRICASPFFLCLLIVRRRRLPNCTQNAPKMHEEMMPTALEQNITTIIAMFCYFVSRKVDIQATLEIQPTNYVCLRTKPHTTASDIRKTQEENDSMII
jgi:hypothetical protein